MTGKHRTTVGLAAVLVAACSLLVPTNATCVLPVSPFQVRSGTPQDHEMRHPGDPNYKNVKAVDLAVRTAGQAVYAVESGRLSTGGSFAISSGSESKWGWSFEVITKDGRHFFYTHVANPLATNPATGKPWGPGAAVTQGQLLGWVAQPPAGKPAHLHFAHKEGNPCAYLRGCFSNSGAAPDNLPC